MSIIQRVLWYKTQTKEAVCVGGAEFPVISLLSCIRPGQTSRQSESLCTMLNRASGLAS